MHLIMLTIIIIPFYLFTREILAVRFVMCFYTLCILMGPIAENIILK